MWTEEYIVHVLMGDSEGEDALISALAEKGITFEHYEGSASDKALNETIKMF